MLKHVFLGLLGLAFCFLSVKGQDIVQITDSVSSRIYPGTMSGDGSRIFYLRVRFLNPNQAGVGTIYMRRLGSAVPEILAENIQLDWMYTNRDGSRLVYGVDSLFTESGNTQEQFSGLPNDYPPNPFPSVSIDESGSNIVFAALSKLRTEDPDLKTTYIYLAQIAGSQIHVRFLGAGFAPVVSANGQVVVFGANVEGKQRLFVFRQTGSAPPLEIGLGSVESISADGEWTASVLGGLEISVIRTDGSFKKSFTPADVGNGLKSVKISGDGRTIVAFGSAKSSLFFAAFNKDGQEINRVAFTNPGDIYEWSLDSQGKHAYFSSSMGAPRNEDRNVEVFAARLAPFSYWIPEVRSDQNAFTGIALLVSGQVVCTQHIQLIVDCPFEAVTVSFTARDENGNLVSSPGVQNPVVRKVGPDRQLATLLPEIFGTGLAGQPITLQIESNKSLYSQYIIGSGSGFQGSQASDVASTNWIFPVSSGPFENVSLVLVNSGDIPASVLIAFNSAPFARPQTLMISAKGTAVLDLSSESLLLLGSIQPILQIYSSIPVQAELRLKRESSGRAASVSVPPLAPAAVTDLLIFPHVAVGGHYKTRIWIANPTGVQAEIALEFIDPAGQSRSCQFACEGHIAAPERTGLVDRSWR